MDRAATESVRRKFDRIDNALFENRSTGNVRVEALQRWELDRLLLVDCLLPKTVGYCSRACW